VAKSYPLWPFRLGHCPTNELKAQVADQVLQPAERGITGKAFHHNGGTALRAIGLWCLDCSGPARTKSPNVSSAQNTGRILATCIQVWQEPELQADRRRQGG
jgi:hypothetical protein